MIVVLEFVLLLIGFALLVKGADFFVEGSSAVAKKLKIPPIVIGLTIVAIGTSLPELAVSSLSSFQDSDAIAYSNVIGSNIFNLLMVLGGTALFISIPVKNSVLKREFPFLIGITAVLVFLAGDAFLFSGKIKEINIFRFSVAGEKIGVISRLNGLFLVLLYLFFIAFTVRYALNEREEIEDEEVEHRIGNGRCALFIIGGALGVIGGGELVVQCAKHLAISAGMSETLAGLTIVALGTSLPELVTSIIAARKGEADIAIGNVVGSNVTNILLVFGLSATISPVGIFAMSLVDVIICFVATIITFIASRTNRSIHRLEGVVLILIYLAYMAYILARQYS